MIACLAEPLATSESGLNLLSSSMRSISKYYVLIYPTTRLMDFTAQT